MGEFKLKEERKSSHREIELQVDALEELQELYVIPWMRNLTLRIASCELFTSPQKFLCSYKISLESLINFTIININHLINIKTLLIIDRRKTTNTLDPPRRKTTTHTFVHANLKNRNYYYSQKDKRHIQKWKAKQQISTKRYHHHPNQLKSTTATSKGCSINQSISPRKCMRRQD